MTQDKNLTPKKSIDQKTRQTQASTNRMKAHNSRTQHRSKPGLRRQQHFRSNETVDQNFLKQKNQPTKISYPGVC